MNEQEYIDDTFARIKEAFRQAIDLGTEGMKEKKTKNLGELAKIMLPVADAFQARLTAKRAGGDMLEVAIEEHDQALLALMLSLTKTKDMLPECITAIAMEAEIRLASGK